MSTVRTYLRNNVNRNLQHYKIIAYEATSFFYINGKINSLKEFLKKSSCLGLTECLGSADIEDCFRFIQTVAYG